MDAMDGSLTQKYIMCTEDLMSNKYKEKKIRLKYNNVNKKENVDFETIERFCKALQNIDKRNKQEKELLKILRTKEFNYKENEYYKIKEKEQEQKKKEQEQKKKEQKQEQEQKKKKEQEQEQKKEQEQEQKKEKEEEKEKDFIYSNLYLHAHLKILDISFNNLNETNLFQIVAAVYNSPNIIGLNLKYNKITTNIFQKIISILNENDYFNYLNIQNTDLNSPAIKTIIFYSLNKNNMKTLKLPALPLDVFQTLTNNLKNNSSLEKLYFSITTSNTNSNPLTKNMENEIANINQQHLINKLKKQFDIFLDIVENVHNLTKIKCTIDFKDSEFEENIKDLVSICEEHKQLLEKENSLRKNKININSADIINLLKTDIAGQHPHISKFEKEESRIFETVTSNMIQKMLS